MADLRAFLAEMARTPPSLGRLDCALTLADWWAVNHGVDPASHLRGTYHDEASCAALLARHRGLVRLVRDICQNIGASRTQVPQPGDIAVVKFAGQHLGAIRATSGKWAIKCSRGLVVTSRCKPLAMWSV